MPNAHAANICKALHLDAAHSYVQDSNPSANLPYHNMVHTSWMILDVYLGAAEYYSLPRESTVNLVTAALFHDYNHSGGKERDSVNIERALAGYQRFIELDAFDERSVPDHEVVKNLIRCTEYPFVVEPDTLLEAIIRDADLMSLGHGDWESQVMNGLREELEVTFGRPISRTDMAYGQLHFHETVKWYTPWGIAFREQYIHPRLIALRLDIQ